MQENVTSDFLNQNMQKQFYKHLFKNGLSLRYRLLKFFRKLVRELISKSNQFIPCTRLRNYGINCNRSKRYLIEIQANYKNVIEIWRNVFATLIKRRFKKSLAPRASEGKYFQTNVYELFFTLLGVVMCAVPCPWIHKIKN